ncbi:DUF4203 domain-containing protein [candidate division KSB1 bacterium]|nr:DUF4203 domain-containing protein [candidate division KSB1 bacterium]
MPIDQLINESTALIFILAGVLNAIAGYRLFRILLAIWGFILGFALVSAIFSYLALENDYTTFIGSLIGGILGAVALYSFYKIGVFIIGAFLGYLFVNFLVSAGSVEANAIISIIVGCIFGILALALERPMIILSTAFAGSWQIVVGGAFYLGTEFEILKYFSNPSLIKYNQDLFFWWMLVVWIVLGIVGTAIQFKYTARKK